VHVTTRIRSAVGFGLATTFLLALTACSGGGAKPSSQRFSERPMGSVAGAPQGYWEYLPPGYGDGAKRPLLIALHGSGENGTGTKGSLRKLLDTGIPKLIERDEWAASRPFIVLAPQHTGALPDSCPDPGEIDGFLRFAMKHYDVDAHRVYLTGLSCGAIGAWAYLATHEDERLAGAVLIAGYGGEAMAYAGCALGKVPIWAFHGSADKTVDPTAGTIRPMAELEKCTDPKPVEARITIYDGVGHDSWDRTYDLSAGHDIYAWLLSHQHV
jgi:predicted peptidase